MFSNMLFPLSFVLLVARIWPSVHAVCPIISIRERDRLSTCSIQETYGNEPFPTCGFLLHPVSCTLFKVEKWDDPAIPYCKTRECGFHLNVFVSGTTFSRNRINLTISEPLHEPLWFMYENSTISEAKCFALEKNDLKSECNRSLVHTYNNNSHAQSVICPLAASDSYSTVKVFINGRKMQYTFRNLYNKALLDGVIFFYSSTTEGQNKPIIITFQAIPDVLNYIVELWSKEQNKSINTLSVDLLDNTTYTERFADLVTLTVSDGFLKSGPYEVTVQCLVQQASDQLCCNGSKTFEFNIREQYGTLEIVISVTLIFLTLFFILVIIALYLRREVLKPLPDNLELLLVYDAVSLQHTSYVKATRIFLQDLLGIKVLLDIVDIPETKQKSPYKWYSSAISSADYVALIVPPKSQPDVCPGSPYRNVYELSLNNMKSDFEEALKNRANLRNKYLKLVLPDSDLRNVPDFYNFAAVFQIPQDYFCLRQHIHRALASHYVRLPRWLLSSQTNSIDAKFDEILDIVQRSSDHPAILPAIDSNCNTPLIAKDEPILCNTKYFDSIYGSEITSVRLLPAVKNPSNSESTII